MIDVLTNQRLFAIESKSVSASCIRFCAQEILAPGAGRCGADTYDGLVLVKHLVVFGERDEEDERGDVFEAVDPLLALGALATDVEETVGELANLERRLGDAGRLDTGAEDILVRRQVVGVGHAVDRAEVVDGGVGELELSRAGDGMLDTRVVPEAADSVGDVTREDVTLDLGRERKNDCAPGVILWLERDIELRHGLEDGARGGS
jgi:hypothetical protein